MNTKHFLGVIISILTVICILQVYQGLNQKKEITHQQSVILERVKDSLIRDACQKYNEFQEKYHSEDMQELYVTLQCMKSDALDQLEMFRRERAAKEDDENYYTSGQKQYAEQCMSILPRLIKVINTYLVALEEQDVNRLNSLNIKLEDVLEELNANKARYENGLYKRQPKRGYTIR